MQSLPKRTNTDLSLSLLDFQNIEFEIHYRKLICFRQLCRLYPVYTAKDIFLYRLINFNSQISPQCGFIPGIRRILGKYSLMQLIHIFTENGTFISKVLGNVWSVKKIVSYVRQKVQSSPSRNRIINILGSDKENIMWNLWKQFPQYLPLAQKAVRLFGRMFSVKWPLW